MEREYTQEDSDNIFTLRRGTQLLKEIQKTPPGEYVVFSQGKNKLRGDDTVRKIWLGACAGLFVQLTDRGLQAEAREALDGA